MMNNDYKEQCWKRYLENKKYEKYDKEDLVDEIIELQQENQQLKNNRNKAIEEIKYLISNCDISDYQGEKLKNILKGDSE